MSLTVAYNIARESLASTATTTSVASRNVANVDNPNAGRKTAVVVTDTSGGTRLAGIASAIDDALFERAVASTSARSGLETVAGALDRLQVVVGDPQAGSSPAAQIGALRAALQMAAGAPHDELTARRVLMAAVSVADTLNAAAEVVERERRQAQLGLEEGVARLRSLLSEFVKVNERIVAAPARQSDVTDDIDRRNGLVREVAELVEVRHATRGGNDMMLFLGNGATLVETTAREIAFEKGAPLLAGEPGTGLRIDGVAMGSGDGIGGRLGNLLRVRDEIAPMFGRQLDEIARGLIVATSERDQSAVPSLPDLAGLFTYSGGPALPAPAAVADGLAAEIAVNSNIDPTAGGILSRIRDGGISAPGNPAYIYNDEGGAGFSGRLLALIDALVESQPFDPSAALPASGVGVVAYATSSAGWLEAERQQTASALEDKKVVNERTVGAWQSRVGINVDDEMAILIALQRSYQASTRLVSAVNEMFGALLDATR